MADSFGHFAEYHERLLTGVELDNRKAARRVRLLCVCCGYSRLRSECPLLAQNRSASQRGWFTSVISCANSACSPHLPHQRPRQLTDIWLHSNNLRRTQPPDDLPLARTLNLTIAQESRQDFLMLQAP